MDLKEVLKLYKESPFYEKYKDNYISDKILKNVFGVDLRIHRKYGLKTYTQVHQLNVEVMKDILNLLSIPSKVTDDEVLWNIVYASYIDPDAYAIKKIGGVSCSADGLLSIRRIFGKYGMSEDTINDYERYRQIPIFLFPREKMGINMSRYSVFGDRIDHTLFDLKRCFNENNCKLFRAYNLSKTSEWIKEIRTFKNLVDQYEIKDIFVNDNYEIYDLEKDDGSIITDYRDKYSRTWNDSYYDNLKKKIDGFYEKKINKRRKI